MKTIKIEIENKHLADLGVEQEQTYADFHFNESQLVGYWISEADNNIKFYAGIQEFICALTDKNIKILNEALTVSQFVL
jgi:hypothetical protein